jgi:hypothetical protein
MNREEFMKDLPERAEAKLVELSDQFDETTKLIRDLGERLERAKNLNSHLNAEICTVCELLGIHPEMAEQAAEDLKKKAGAAA